MPYYLVVPDKFPDECSGQGIHHGVTGNTEDTQRLNSLRIPYVLCDSVVNLSFGW